MIMTLFLLHRRSFFLHESLNARTRALGKTPLFTLIVLMITTTSLSAAASLSKGNSDSLNSPHEHKLSDKDHYGADDAHNNDYDHEAFLGREDAQTFDELSDEESKKRLGIIVDRIDADKDGLVTFDELKNWIVFVQKRYITEDVERQWKSHEVKGDGELTWQEYYNVSYGFVEQNQLETANLANGHNSYSEVIERDQHRFEAADRDQNGFLSKEEFTDFLHPEEGGAHMRDVVIHETIADIDKDGDGLVNMKEYLADLWSGGDGDEEEAEPEWLAEERKQFVDFRDKNKDGKLDRQEVEEWILPHDLDHSEVETKHLIAEADDNRDLVLTKEEIVDKHDLFVGSQATDFGDILLRHDEF